MTNNTAHAATVDDSYNYLSHDISYSYAGQPTVAILSPNSAYSVTSANGDRTKSSLSDSGSQENLSTSENSAYGATRVSVSSSQENVSTAVNGAYGATSVSESGSQEKLSTIVNGAYGATSRVGEEELYISSSFNHELMCYSYATEPTLAYLSSNTAYNAHLANCTNSSNDKSPTKNIAECKPVDDESG